jgi:hypothetical protein
MKLLVEAGMKLTQRPSLSSDEFMHWNRWLQDQSNAPTPSIPVRVDVDRELVVVHGKSFEIEMQLAAIVQCLLDAQGERRSCADMKRLYPTQIVDDRLDITISRKLKNHKSGVGHFIASDTRGFWLTSADEIE